MSAWVSSSMILLFVRPFTSTSAPKLHGIQSATGCLNLPSFRTTLPHEALPHQVTGEPGGAISRAIRRIVFFCYRGLPLCNAHNPKGVSQQIWLLAIFEAFCSKKPSLEPSFYLSLPTQDTGESDLLTNPLDCR
jgi:hypothetical protein